jgi:hypothetical protein
VAAGCTVCSCLSRRVLIAYSPITSKPQHRPDGQLGRTAGGGMPTDHPVLLCCCAAAHAANAQLLGCVHRANRHTELPSTVKCSDTVCCHYGLVHRMLQSGTARLPALYSTARSGVAQTEGMPLTGWSHSMACTRCPRLCQQSISQQMQVVL